MGKNRKRLSRTKSLYLKKTRRKKGKEESMYKRKKYLVRLSVSYLSISYSE